MLRHAAAWLFLDAPLGVLWIGVWAMAAGFAVLLWMLVTNGAGCPAI